MIQREKEVKSRWQQEGVVFFVYKDGLVLLEKRSMNDESYGGYIVIPGGKCEEEELPEEALKREMNEELGVTPLSCVHLDTFEHISLNGKHYLSHAYLITEYEGKVVEKEQGKSVHIWVSLTEAEELLRLGSSRLILFKASQTLKEER